jgi:hypothetical protein
LPELFLIEEQSIRNLINVTSEPNGSERSPYIHLDHRLSEVMIDVDYECGDRLILLQGRQSRNMFLQGPNNTTSSIWKI